ncbi:MAG: PHP domain-containing protein [Actinomycetota bacterium]|nr:PHP domain-containing protein [Actinomycetota bacterium]
MIDLHAHTNHSDGKDTPTELVQNAAKAGVKILAITDHDTVSGWDEAITSAQSHGLGLIPGIEVSTRAVTPSGHGVSVHMLAYLPDPNNQALITALNRTKESRMVRAREMVARLSKDYPIDFELVLSQLPQGSTIGRPAIADALVEAGIVPTRSDAFTSILHRSSPYYVSEKSLDTIEAITLIRQAGGVSVMAHPLIDFPPGAKREDLPRAHFETLIEAGLNGLEVDHRAVPNVAKVWLRDLALKHNLIVTGSSDYHGVGGKDNLLGENVTSPEMLDRIIDQASGFEPLT